jgi:hypothetical protein
MQENKLAVLKKVAFPKEHGSWGFVLEPLILSLLVAFSINGLIFALSAFILFLSKQSIQIIFTNSGPTYLKSSAKKVLAIYFVVVILFFLHLISNTELILLIPFTIGLMLMLLFLFLDHIGKARELLFEFIPAIALTSMSISIVLMDDTFSFNVLVFGILLLSRSVPTIFYINAKVKEAKGKYFSPLPTLMANGFFTLIVIYFAINNLLPALSILGSLLILFRSMIGFSKFNFTKKVVQIGIAEFIYGILFVIINAIAF